MYRKQGTGFADNQHDVQYKGLHNDRDQKTATSRICHIKARKQC